MVIVWGFLSCFRVVIVVCMMLIVFDELSDFDSMLWILVYLSMVWIGLLVMILVLVVVGWSRIILVVVLFCMGCGMVLLMCGMWKKLCLVFLIFFEIVRGILWVLL